jgi:LIVCS family branched-chain amino acid:cation transporter
MTGRFSFTQRLLLGLTLFSMFFGAGNLIFPPYLGSLAGTDMPWAMAGFVITAVCFPILGVMTVARSDGLMMLASRVHPQFAFIFTLLIYLSIGPCVAIPRTASTSFEMALAPLFSNSAEPVFMDFSSVVCAQFVYSVFFFVLAGLMALKPEKLTQRLGKFTSPALITMIALLFIACVFNPIAGYGLVLPPYDINAFVRGFLEGYQTMDTLAALNFGLIIALNVQALGVKTTEDVVKETVKAGLIAGFFLITIYMALAHIGATVGGAGLITENGAQTLTSVAKIQFGSWGIILLGMIFFVACLNTCVGLLSCCSDYFSKVFPSLSYRGWLLVFVLCSMVVSNAGLTLILKLSIPVLMAIYPVALMLIILGLTHQFNRHYSKVYPLTITFTAVVSIAGAIQDIGVSIPLLSYLPFYSIGLEWVTPALIGWVIGGFYSHRRADS